MDTVTINYMAILALAVLAVIVEMFFEWLFGMWLFDKPFFKKLKPWIVFGFSLVICAVYNIDLLALLFGVATIHWSGIVLAAGTVAGGSKRIMRMFKRMDALAKVASESKKKYVAKQIEKNGKVE